MGSSKSCKEPSWLILSELRWITCWRYLFFGSVKGNPGIGKKSYRGSEIVSTPASRQIIMCLRLPYKFGCRKYCCVVGCLSYHQQSFRDLRNSLCWWVTGTALQHWYFNVCTGFTVFFLPSDHQRWGGARWSHWSSKAFQHPRRLNSGKETPQ